MLKSEPKYRESIPGSYLQVNSSLESPLPEVRLQRHLPRCYIYLTTLILIEQAIPRTPLLRTKLLPMISPVNNIVLAHGTQKNRERPIDLFPVGIFSSLIDERQRRLSEIRITLPATVETPSARIGIIEGVIDKEITALGAISILKEFSEEPVSHQTYSDIPRDMKGRVRTAYLERHHFSSVAQLGWDFFDAGISSENGPIGADFLLGCERIWGFESTPGTHSVIHLD
ncbi:hypothetical protein NP233_g2462 [Leucocoprinus birnbaumii]|uniref:Uncharacterized protein n=1 Tax=Leucocoprinus birnbaumii TaxID=56174 RepID=A0AAD5VYU9_9AGAR|nr:hypothetical protein NP233_g2462 [Leucocoprinus birnbaumii]